MRLHLRCDDTEELEHHHRIEWWSPPPSTAKAGRRSVWGKNPCALAIAIVPLLLIKMKVIIAIRMRGMVVPPIVKAKTLLGLGQGTLVDMRTVM